MGGRGGGALWRSRHGVEGIGGLGDMGLAGVWGGGEGVD